MAVAVSTIPVVEQTFSHNNVAIKIVVPDSRLLHQWYLDQLSETPFPYWGKVWASAIALSKFIVEHNTLFANKTVLELAAGLGLPSLTSALFAKKIICTDYVEDPLTFVKQSAKLNTFNNVDIMLFDWKKPPTDITADIVLMSDVNYNPNDFDDLYQLIQQFICSNTTIVLSTPQRIAGKTFIQSIQSFCKYQEVMMVEEAMGKTAVNIFVL